MCKIEWVQCKSQGVQPTYSLQILNNWHYQTLGGPGVAGLQLVDPDSKILDIYAQNTEYSLEEIYELFDDNIDSPVRSGYGSLVISDGKILTKNFSTIGNMKILYITVENKSNPEKIYFFLYPNNYDNLNTLYRVTHHNESGEYFELTEEHKSIIQSIEFLPEKINKGC